MSIVICNGCDRWVDSDADMDCFVGAYEPVRFKCPPDSDHVLCEWCRDAYRDDEDEHSVADASA
jgi:hypothetical protein